MSTAQRPPSPTQKERGYTLDEARMYPLYSVGILATETEWRPVARKGDTALGQGKWTALDPTRGRMDRDLLLRDRVLPAPLVRGLIEGSL